MIDKPMIVLVPPGEIMNSETTQTAAPVDRLVTRLLQQPQELYDLLDRLSRFSVFGPWREREGGFERPEPGKNGSRVKVWECDGSYDLDAGWYYRLGRGVIGIAALNNREPFSTADECKAEVDAILTQVTDVVVVTTDTTG